MIAATLAAALLAGTPPDSTRPAAPAVAAEPVAARDPWFGSDKLKHFVLAGFAETTAFAAARWAGVDRRPALAGAVVAAAAISIGKEVADRRRGGRASVRDLVWDAAGIAAYGLLLARTTR